GHKRAAAGRADGGGREESRVSHTLIRQAIEVRRGDLFRAVAGEIGAEIFGNEPDDVGAVSSSRAGNKQEAHAEAQRRRAAVGENPLNHMNAHFSLFFAPLRLLRETNNREKVQGARYPPFVFAKRPNGTRYRPRYRAA